MKTLGRVLFILQSLVEYICVIIMSRKRAFGQAFESSPESVKTARTDEKPVHTSRKRSLEQCAPDSASAAPSHKRARRDAYDMPVFVSPSEAEVSMAERVHRYYQCINGLLKWLHLNRRRDDDDDSNGSGCAEPWQSHSHAPLSPFVAAY